MINQDHQSDKPITADDQKQEKPGTVAASTSPQKDKNAVLGSILEKYRHYAGDAGTELIVKAYEYALQAHEAQRRAMA